MNVNDWFEVDNSDNISMFSANSVPYPHDEWLKLTNQITVDQAVRLVKKWNKI